MWGRCEAKLILGKYDRAERNVFHVTKILANIFFSLLFGRRVQIDCFTINYNSERVLLQFWCSVLPSENGSWKSQRWDIYGALAFSIPLCLLAGIHVIYDISPSYPFLYHKIYNKSNIHFCATNEEHDGNPLVFQYNVSPKSLDMDHAGA